MVVAGVVVSAEVVAALEEKNAVAVETHTAFFDVRGGEEVVAVVFAVAASVAVAAAGCGWRLHLVVAAENWRNTH